MDWGFIFWWLAVDHSGKGLLEPISKMSFGPISLLVPRFKSSTYNSMPAVYDPQKYNKIDGNPATLENSAPPQS
jgi:hypothetical protein